MTDLCVGFSLLRIKFLWLLLFFIVLSDTQLAVQDDKFAQRCCDSRQVDRLPEDDTGRVHQSRPGLQDHSTGRKISFT